LGFGTAPLGGLFTPVAEEDAAAALETAFASGISFFDTAPLYGAGLAEDRLGRALRGRKRDSFFVSTKVGRLIREGSAVYDFSYEGVLRSARESLERLSLDHVDLLYIHDPAEHLEEALAEALAALEDTREAGLVSAIGVGTPDLPSLLTFIERTSIDCILLPGRYTLLDRSALISVLPACVERDVSVVAGGVYNSGILANPRETPYFDYRPADERLRNRALQLESICSRYGVPLAAAALQFPWRHPAIESVLVGCRSDQEVEAAVRLLDLPIPRELWEELDADHVPTDAR
jgi:D-threo-aldose 1-dehydrogenase